MDNKIKTIYHAPVHWVHTTWPSALLHCKLTYSLPYIHWYTLKWMLKPN